MIYSLIRLFVSKLPDQISLQVRLAVSPPQGQTFGTMHRCLIPKWAIAHYSYTLASSPSLTPLPHGKGLFQRSWMILKPLLGFRIILEKTSRFSPQGRKPSKNWSF